MAQAVKLAALFGTETVEKALGLAAVAGRFDDGDLVSIIERSRIHNTVIGAFSAALADETHSTQPGIGAWEGLGR